MKIDITNKSGNNKRIRLIPKAGASATLPIDTVNPTLMIDEGNGEVTVCLANGGPVENDYIQPDFALYLKDVGGTVTDDNGNVYNGSLRSMSMTGVESFFMAVINAPATQDSSFDNENQCVHVGLSSQVLAGDFLNVKVTCLVLGSPVVDNETQFTVLGSDIANGYVKLPFSDVFNRSGGDVQYTVEIKVYRGKIAQSSNALIGSAPEVIVGRITYKIYGNLYTSYRWLGNKLWLRIISDVEDSGPTSYGYHLFNWVPANINENTLIPIGQRLTVDPVEVQYGSFESCPTLLQRYTGSTQNTVSYDIYDIALDITIPVVFSVPWGYYNTKYPIIMASTDGNVLTLQNPETLGANNVIGGALQRNGNVYEVVQSASGDYTNMSGMVTEGLYRNTSLFQNPVTWGGTWNNNGTVLFVVIPNAGTTNEDLTGVKEQNTPIIYELVSRSPTGKHVMQVSPSQASFIAVLEKYGIYNRNRDNSVHYDFQMLNSGSYVFAYPSISSGGEKPQPSFLFYNNAGTWVMHTIFVPRGIVVPDSIPNYYESNQLIRDLGAHIVWETARSQNDEMILFRAVDEKLHFTDTMNTVLSLKALKLGSNTWFDLKFVKE